MIGVGIIGAGRVCAAHAQAALALQGTRLVAVADTDAERVANAVRNYGGRGYTDYRQLLEDPEVEAVIVALPHHLHREATLDALRAGRHVLLEKPMAMNVAECDEMIAAARRAGRVLMVGHSQHFFPVNREARRRIREGEIGRLVLATDTWYKPFHDGVRPAWFLDAAQGGGMWAMNGSHMIDRMRFLLDRRVKAVKARVGNPVFGYSAPDMGVALLEMEDGLCVTLQHVGYRDGVNRFEAEITGSEGQIRLSGDRGGGACYWRSRQGRWEEVPVAPPELPLEPGRGQANPVFAAQLLEFVAAIREGREPETSGEYGREVVRVLQACEESSRIGAEVRL